MIVLTEWQGAMKHARDFADRTGHEVAGAATDTLLLTKGRVIERQQHDMSEPWFWGPHRWKLRKRSPRTYLEALIDIDGQRLPVLGVHLPPGGPAGARWRTGGKNKAAWWESARFVKRWLDEHPDGVVVGDLNATRREVRKHITIRYANTGKVDGVAWGRNFDHRSTRKVSGNPGHGAGVVTLTKES